MRIVARLHEPRVGTHMQSRRMIELIMRGFNLRGDDIRAQNRFQLHVG